MRSATGWRRSPDKVEVFLAKSLISLGALVVFLLFSPPALAGDLNRHCRCRDITPEQMWRFDDRLRLSRADQQRALEKHLPWGVPENPQDADNERLLVQRHYVINHDGDLRTATWTAYRLQKRDVQVSRQRRECFRKDVRLKTSHAGLCADYKEPTYDQGHLVPNSDMKRSLQAMINTYMMSNMAPQHCAFNRGTWLILESLVRHWAEEKGTIYIVTGSVFDRDGTPGRDADAQALRMRSDSGNERVAVPSHFYKILLQKRSDGSIETLSVLLPHVETKIVSGTAAERQYLDEHIASIDEIEALTGINFLSDLEDSDPAVARTVESSKADTLWAEPQSWPGRLDGNC